MEMIIKHIDDGCLNRWRSVCDLPLAVGQQLLSRYLLEELITKISVPETYGLKSVEWRHLNPPVW